MSKDNGYGSHPSLAEMMGSAPMSEQEIAGLRRRAWLEQGILLIRPSDMRLSREEASLLRRIAGRLYGGEQS